MVEKNYRLNSYLFCSIKTKSNIYIFVDISRNNKNIYAILVVMEERIRTLGRSLNWVKHRRKLGKYRKKSYDIAFIRRLQKVDKNIEEIKILYSINSLIEYLFSLEKRFNIVKIYMDDYVLHKLSPNIMEKLPIIP